MAMLSIAQNTKQERLAFDSAYIDFVEDSESPAKVLHAEPLYVDLIRDLGARKGEHEWNVGLGMTDNLDFDSYDFLVEYEFAPINRLGVEFELPFTFFSGRKGVPSDSVPSSTLNALQVATQWTFLVNERISTSLALGYLHEFEMTAFDDFGNPLFKGNVFNPFFVAAKRWGRVFHTLIYTGPAIEKQFNSDEWEVEYEINTNLHYMIPGTTNFIGIEFNKSIEDGDFDMTMRPQMRVEISHDLMIGIVAGIPVARENERLSTFLRLIWEPGGTFD